MLTDRLRDLRKANKLTQQQVADALRLERSTYTYYETGKTQPPLPTLIRLARMFEVSLDYLVDSPEPTPGVMRSVPPVYFRTEELPDLRTLPKDEKQLLIRYRQMSGEQKEQLIADIEEIINKENE